MNRTFHLLLLLLLIKLISANNNAVLALTWMAGHCETLGSTCDKTKYEQWDHQSFTIHGLWPTQRTDRQYGRFNFGLFKGTLLQEMYSYWPPQPKTGGIPHFLWDFQWKKHGVSYADIMMTLTPSAFNMYGIKDRNEKLQIHFFTKVIELYKKLNVRKVPKMRYTKGQFASLIKLPQQSFFFVCSESGTFLEVRICYRITATGFITRECAKTASNCPGQYANLKDWRSNEIVIKPNIKNDAQMQQSGDKLKDKVAPVYKPVQQKKIDEKIQKLSVDTKGKEEQIVIVSTQTKEKQSQIKIVGADTKDKQQILIQQQKQVLSELQFQQYNLEEPSDIRRGGQISEEQLISTVVTYMLITAFLVSIFWIAIIILFYRVCRRQVSDGLVEENTGSNIESKQIQ